MAVGNEQRASLSLPSGSWSMLHSQGGISVQGRSRDSLGLLQRVRDVALRHVHTICGGRAENSGTQLRPPP
jgi:hypothetical protein